jgi:hypothetical protein
MAGGERPSIPWSPGTIDGGASVTWCGTLIGVLCSRSYPEGRSASCWVGSNIGHLRASSTRSATYAIPTPAIPTPQAHILVMDVLEQRIARLRDQVQLVAEDLPRLTAQVASGDTAASHFIDRLRIATDNATGVVLLADARLSAPVLAVERSLLESLITTHWASISDSNTEEIITVARLETRRLMRNILKKALLRSAITLRAKMRRRRLSIII